MVGEYGRGNFILPAHRQGYWNNSTLPVWGVRRIEKELKKRGAMAEYRAKEIKNGYDRVTGNEYEHLCGHLYNADIQKL